MIDHTYQNPRSFRRSQWQTDELYLIMRSRTGVILTWLTSLTVASSLPEPITLSQASATQTSTASLPPPQSITTIPTRTAYPASTSLCLPPSTQLYDTLATNKAYSYLLNDLDSDRELRKRQGGVAVSNPIPPPTVAVQMPSVTAYNIWGGPQIVYTQTFAPHPDPWPAASPGTIGLGTIQGQIGVVKNSKRDLVSQPTAEPTITKTSTLRIRGREVGVS